MKKIFSWIMLTLFLLPLLATEAIADVTPPSLPITYNGNTYSQAIKYTGPMGTHTCYFENGEIVAGYLPGYFWISHDRRYDPDDVCGGTYESAGQLAVQLTQYTVDCSAHKNIFSSIELIVPSGWGSEFELCGYTYSLDESFPQETTFLSFPLSGVTPYTASVSSVMDQTTLGTGAVYGSGADSEVIAFNGEVGDVGPYSGTTCYRKANSSAFLATGFNYDGYTGGPTYLCYDAHPGYDYPKAENTSILATAGGDLCIATNVTSKPSPATSVWRDTSKCPLANAPGQTGVNWTDYHVIYIMHGPMYINDSIDEYMTVYLHTKDLDSTVQADIFDDGYATVTRSQTIGRVGDISVDDVGFHVHMETYKKVSSTWERVDPYGDGTNNILWEH